MDLIENDGKNDFQVLNDRENGEKLEGKNQTSTYFPSTSRSQEQDRPKPETVFASIQFCYGNVGDFSSRRMVLRSAIYEQTAGHVACIGYCGDQAHDPNRASYAQTRLFEPGHVAQQFRGWAQQHLKS